MSKHHGQAKHKEKHPPGWRGVPAHPDSPAGDGGPGHFTHSGPIGGSTGDASHGFLWHMLELENKSLQYLNNFLHGTAQAPAHGDESVPTAKSLSDRAPLPSGFDILLQVPWYSQEKDGPGNIKGPQACLRVNKAMAKDYKGRDGKGSGVMLNGNHCFQVAITEDEDGKLAKVDSQEAKDGLAYINSQLVIDHPVVVGVSYKASDKKHPNPNNDHITDHFVIIIGRKNSSGVVNYIFLDPATKHVEKSCGKFFMDKRGVLVKEGDKSSGSTVDQHYEVSMIRKNL